MKELVMNVEGMHCEGCENRIQNALMNVEGIEKVFANHSDGTVKIMANTSVEMSTIKETIEDIGFEVKEN